MGEGTSAGEIFNVKFDSEDKYLAAGKLLI
jgi:hypothetical protein